MIHRINVFLLSLIVAFAPVYFTSAHASAAEKWTIEEISYDNVAKNIKIQAEKNYGPSANDNKYKVKVPVTPGAAGSTALSMIRMGLAGAALYGLVEGVGWIIENGVVKKVDPATMPDPDSNLDYLWVDATSWSTSSPQLNCSARFTGSSTAAVAHFKSCAELNGFLEPKCTFKTVSSYSCSVKRHDGIVWSHYTVDRIVNPDYDPDLKPSYIPVTPSEMGEEIINSPAAPQILPDIYNPNNPVTRPSPAPDSADKALENAPPIPKQNPNGDTKQKPNEDTDGDGEPDVYNPDKPSVGTEFTLPEFCSWAVTVCEWYTKYKEDSDLAKEHRDAEKQVWTQEEIARQEEKQQREDEKSFWQKVEDWFDWSKEDPELQDEPLEIEEQQIIDYEHVNYVQFGSSCPFSPSLISLPMGILGSMEFEQDLTFICDFGAEARPYVIGLGHLGALIFLLIGIRNGNG